MKPNNLIIKPKWIFEARDNKGRIMWRGDGKNLIMNQGANYLLNAAMVNATQSPGWFIGLTTGSPVPSLTDTLSAHGWTEQQGYTEAARQGWNIQSSTARALTNTASKAVFTANADGVVVGGAFLCDNSTKGGSSGNLFGCAANPAGNQTLDTGNTVTILVSYTIP